MFWTCSHEFLHRLLNVLVLCLCGTLSQLKTNTFYLCIRYNTGGGEREKVFWRNYFFHCANARYEAGLSIDEIWCEDQQKSDKPDGTDADQAEAKTREETITFDNADEKADSEKKAFPAEPVTDTDAPFSTETEPISEVNDFEMVAGDDDGGADDNVVDYELDALEAEIARELEE
jgi:hypothetical protein